MRIALLAFLVAKSCVADNYGVAVAEEVFRHTGRIDSNAVFAAPINYSCNVTICLNHGMATADVYGINLNVIVSCSTDGQALLEERKAQVLIIDGADQNPRNLFSAWGPLDLIDL